MKNKVTLKQRLQYEFENTLSKGTIALILWLTVISFVVISCAAIVFIATGIVDEGQDKMSFWEAMWESLMFTFDAGTLGGAKAWGFRMVMLVVTIGGIFIFSTLIGILSSGLQAKIDEMRKGRSKVLETNHTLILGWSSKIYSIISELIVANESERKSSIVILADKDKVWMEDELNSQIKDFKRTRIICRTGNPIDLNDLAISSPNEAKSIIILGPEEVNHDLHIIKVVLALTNHPNRKASKYHIVSEIKDITNMEAADLVGGDEAVYIYSANLIARVTAQTCRQSGLSIVYTELLDFDGAEIYFKAFPELAGKTFKESLFMFDNSAIIGYMNKDGIVEINPNSDKILESGDTLISVVEDDSVFVTTPNSIAKPDLSLIVNRIKEEPKEEKNLIIGWNYNGATIIQELDNYVSKNSEVVVLAEIEHADEMFAELQETLKNQKISFIPGKTTDRQTLNNLAIQSFSDIIILAYPFENIQESDAKTLITLLHLRSISEKVGKNFKIVSEMLDIKNRELAEVTKADDYIISDKIASLMISQLSENKHLKKVFDILFSSNGSEIYLKPASDYVTLNKEMDFYTILESAAQKNEIAIGYRIIKYERNPEKAYEGGRFVYHKCLKPWSKHNLSSGKEG